MFGSIGGATPRFSVIGTTLALAGAASFALLAVDVPRGVGGKCPSTRGERAWVVTLSDVSPKGGPGLQRLTSVVPLVNNLRFIR